MFVTIRTVCVCHLIGQCASSTLPPSLRVMCVTAVRVGLNTECVSMGWKPAKQAALERDCFVSLSAGWSHSLLMWERTTGRACRGALPLKLLHRKDWRDVKHISLISKLLAKTETKEEDGWGSCVCYRGAEKCQQFWALRSTAMYYINCSGDKLGISKERSWISSWCILLHGSPQLHIWTPTSKRNTHTHLSNNYKTPFSSCKHNSCRTFWVWCGMMNR